MYNGDYDAEGKRRRVRKHRSTDQREGKVERRSICHMW